MRTPTEFSGGIIPSQGMKEERGKKFYREERQGCEKLKWVFFVSFALFAVQIS